MHLDVWIAAPASDPHATVVAGELAAQGASVACIPLAEIPSWGLEWSGGDTARLHRDGSVWAVDASTSVWWRRPDAPSAGPSGISDPDERALAGDEIRALVPGVLDAVGVAWVDAPWTLLRARQKAVQLAAARACGARTPEFTICGHPGSGAQFAQDRTVVAKAVSTGVGLAPFVAEVPPQALDRLSSCPTMLQELVDATADVRLVTVGDRVFSWVRPRAAGTVDWRRDDPAGSAFAAVTRDPTGGRAAAVSARLGLRFSVQDWLTGPDGGLWFLEVNPQGQWLFLPGAEAAAARALATMLRTGP